MAQVMAVLTEISKLWRLTPSTASVDPDPGLTLRPAPG